MGERGHALLLSTYILNSRLCDTKDVLDLRNDIKPSVCNGSLPYLSPQWQLDTS